LQTKKVAAGIIAALVLALAAPAFTQPFADVPPDHWAYDAIAELAAKGLIEGYPDGTFRGNQPLTRFEMAMIVARIIARIEAIPPPAPLPGDVVRAPALAAVDARLTGAIATLTRLVAEFRAELAALGVRVTAVEEELAAIRARLDHTRITGVFNYLYWGFQTPAQAPRHGLNRFQLTYVGTIAPGLSATLRVRHQTFGNPNAGTGVTGDPASGFGSIFFDRSFLDWTTAFGVPGLRTRLGRDVVTLGPIGLLMDSIYWNARRDGLRADWTVGPVAMMGFAQWATLGQTTMAYVAGGRLSFAPMPGWTLGVNVRNDTNPWVPAYGGFGFSADISGEVIAGLTLRAEYAQYTPTGFPANNYLYAEAVLDLRRLAGIPALAPTLTFWYRSMDPQVFPTGAPPPDPVTPDFLGLYGGGDLRTFGGRIDVELFSNLFAWGLVDTGNVISTLVPFTTWEVGARWVLAPRTTLFLFYADNTTGAVRTNYWGTWLSTSW
jgi:hypothetical protein